MMSRAVPTLLTASATQELGELRFHLFVERKSSLQLMQLLQPIESSIVDDGMLFHSCL